MKAVLGDRISTTRSRPETTWWIVVGRRPTMSAPVQQPVPAAVIGHPVQLGDGERSAGGGPGLRDRHATHAVPFLSILLSGLGALESCRDRQR
jgi:hypothetical protein